MAQGLAEFLSAAAARGFAWGQHDCMLFAADWARELTGADPAAAWRGTYDDEAGALAIVEAAGGWVAIVQDALQAQGWRPAPIRLAPGDIVLVTPPHHPVPVAGVTVAGGRTALLARRGLVVWPLAPFHAWRASHG